MCGLYGYNTKQGVKLGKKQREQRGRILSGLAVAMQARGTHSTGVAGVCKEHKWCMIKQAVSATEFIKTQGYKDFVNHNPRIVIGHTRFATVGEISNDNAHPFQEGNIIGAHNGSVYNHKEVMPEAEVDSQAIFHSLDTSEDFKTAFQKIRGQFAITWFDQREPDKLNMVIDGNPLSIVRIPELQTYFWASVETSLGAVLASHFDMSKNTIWTPKTEMVYTLEGNHGITREAVEFGKYVAPPTACNYSGYGHGYNSQYDDYETGSKYEADEEEKEIAELNNKTYLIGAGKVREDNYHRVMDLSIEDMRLIMNECEECGFCEQPIDTENENMYFAEKERMILCWKCGNELEDWENYTSININDLADIDDELYLLDNVAGGVNSHGN